LMYCIVALSSMLCVAIIVMLCLVVSVFSVSASFVISFEVVKLIESGTNVRSVSLSLEANCNHGSCVSTECSFSCAVMCSVFV